MATSTEERNLAQYTGKKVTVVRNLSEPNEKGEGTVEVEGQVQVANELGLLIKPKGKVQFDLIPIDEIEDVYAAPEKAKQLKASKLKAVEPGQARRHLLERHGVDLTWANSVSEEDAFEYHSGLDHVELKLGHVHDNKDAQESSESEESDSD